MIKYVLGKSGLYSKGNLNTGIVCRKFGIDKSFRLGWAVPA